MSIQPTGQRRKPVVTENKCPYPGCGQERATVDDQVRRHCEGHEIQIWAA